LSSNEREKLAKVASRTTASGSRTPTRLGRVPIIDVAFELRFEPSSPSASELILGMIFKDLGTDLPNVAILPQASFPIEMIQSVPQLQYQPQRLMTGEQFQVALGPKVLAVLCKRPYPGWHLFKPIVRRVLDSLRDTEQVRRVERFSIKYRNVIESSSDHDQLQMLNVQLDVADLGFMDKSALLRVETSTDLFDNLIGIQTHVEAKIDDSNEIIRGVLVDVDTIYQKDLSDYWSAADALLEQAHETEKQVFFAILKPDTIEALKPVWE